jgi:ABC-type glutathione transport system ATPase component
MTGLEVTPVACRLVETYPNWVPHTHPAWTFRSSVSIIIIQHVLRIVLSLVKRLIVLHHGVMLSDGPPAQVLKDAAVIKAYLGTKFGKRPEAEFHQQQQKYQQELQSDRGTHE